MILNAGWSRTVRKSRRKVIEHKNTAGIWVDLPDEALEGDHAAIRATLMQHRPSGEGWTLSGYCLAGKVAA